MRYENLKFDFVDRDFLCFTSDEHEGNIVLSATDELIDLTNKIREKHGNTDLVGIEYDNEVYYNFYLIFDTKKKDDEVYYRLPMTEEEERNVIFQLIEILATELYRG